MPPNLLLDQPPLTAPDRVWVSDITYLPLVGGGWCYLASWMDARATPLFTRRIVGWQVDDIMEDALVIVPLRGALRTRHPPAGLIVHSDRAGPSLRRPICLKRASRLDQFVEDKAQYDRTAEAAGPTTLTITAPADRPSPSRSGRGRPCGRLKAEMLEEGAFLDVQDARTEIFDYIEIYYN